ncbi:MAG: AAA family ATPase [Rikenellaceae bacterium]
MSHNNTTGGQTAMFENPHALEQFDIAPDSPTMQYLVGQRMTMREREEAAAAAAARELDERYNIGDADPNNSLFIVKSANDAISEASLKPNPVALYDTLWYEGEVCCLFADTNVGKSIYAMQIATAVAAKRSVLYFDFELSDKQFQLRYTGNNGEVYRFPDELYRVSLNPAAYALREQSMEDMVLSKIEQSAFEYGVNVVIIDNLTYLCLEAEKGDVAGRMMKRLMEMKTQSDLSILVLAHTPKRSLERPITQNDLAGSKKIINFVDSAFTIGKSAKDESLRYVKQIKVRSGEFTYSDDSVLVCQISKNSTFLELNAIGRESEYHHLRQPTDKEQDELRSQIESMVASGMSIRQVAAQLNVSFSRVQRAVSQRG